MKEKLSAIFQYVLKNLKTIPPYISRLWGMLPAELKVIVYYGLSDAFIELANQIELIKKTIDPSQLILIAGVNIILVFIKSLGQRVPAIRAKFSK